MSDADRKIYSLNQVCEIEEKAYEKGRADKYQEIVSEYMLLTEEQVNQIRADAIEECISKITNEHTHSCYNDDVYECVKLLEQLKEQMLKGTEHGRAD